MIYNCPSRESATVAFVLRLQRLQNKVQSWQFRQAHIYIRDKYVAFKIAYVHQYKNILCRKQVEVIQHHLNPNVLASRHGEDRPMKYKRFKLGGVEVYEC
jgi:hypothetical protein